MPPGRLPVYHVHGFLPRQSRSVSSDSTEIVFSQEEYHAFTLEPFSWQVTTQLYFLRNYVCLFLGTSLRDMNMVRLASHAKAHGKRLSAYVLMARSDVLRESDTNTYDANKKENVFKVRVMSSLCDDIGVRLILCENRESVETRVKTLANILQMSRAGLMEDINAQSGNAIHPE